ncbi:ATP-binding cassette domain-containing protein [Thermoproteota archaeon]
MTHFEVKDLKMYYSTPMGFVKAVNGVSFNIDQGETLGIAGESGCGKTSIAISIMRLFPPNGKIMGGKILIDSVDILKL